MYYPTNITDFPQEPDARLYGSFRFNRSYKPSEGAETLIPLRYTITYYVTFKDKKMITGFNMPAMGS